MPEQEDYKKMRKKVFIDKNLQTKFILKAYIPVLLVIILGTLALIISLIMVDKKLDYSSIEAFINGFVMEWFKKLQNEGGFYGHYKVYIYSGAIILAFIMFGYVAWVFLFFSHRIVGPLFRMQKTFEDVLSGNLALRIKFRDKDEFQDMANKFNTMIEAFGDKVSKSKQLIEEMKKELKSIKSKNNHIVALEKTLNELDKIINHFHFEE